MSYNVMAYQVNADKIKSIWGSKDPEILPRFLTKYKDEIEEQLDWFEIDMDLYQAHFNDIVNGRITHHSHNYLYGYIYELFCWEFGKSIGNDDFLSFLSELTKDNHKAFIPIPGNSDWPEFYSIQFTELDAGRKLFLSNEEEHAKEEYYIETVNEIFDIAEKKKKDLVFIGY